MVKPSDFISATYYPEESMIQIVASNYGNIILLDTSAVCHYQPGDGNEYIEVYKKHATDLIALKIEVWQHDPAFGPSSESHYMMLKIDWSQDRPLQLDRFFPSPKGKPYFFIKGNNGNKYPAIIVDGYTVTNNPDYVDGEDRWYIAACGSISNWLMGRINKRDLTLSIREIRPQTK